MFCVHCGTENPDGARFCRSCGKPVAEGFQSPGLKMDFPEPPAALTVPVYDGAAPAAVLDRQEETGKWPVAAGVFALIALLLNIARPIVLTYSMQRAYGSGNFSIGLSGFVVQIVIALVLAVLLLAHTKKLPWLTAIPRSAGVVQSLIAAGTAVYHGAVLFPRMIIGTYLPLLVSLVLLILYWIFTLRKKVPTAFAVIVLILTILGALGSLLNIFLFGNMPPFSLIDTLMASLTGLTSGIAYVIALFALGEKPAPRTAPPVYRTAAYSGPYAGTGYAPNAQPSYAQSPYAGQEPYDAPSGGYAVLGFFIPVVGLILYLVWKDQTPLRARSAGKGALIGVIVGVVGSILLSILSVVLSFGFLAALY
ncbi:MAG: zinc-ribbon domain-containing protein [Oscillospiraceae bacterium]|nr:zinc-ribbon domain-containing protein [Oscillospiraceae bacterium]